MTRNAARLIASVSLLILCMAVRSLTYASVPPTPHRNPSNLGGPPHPWTGGNSPVPCQRTGGKPVAIVDTYGRNLTILDMPVYYEGVGQDVPFVVYFNSDTHVISGLATIGHWPLNYAWTHSYNIYVLPQLPAGVYVIEGNGWAHYFGKNAGQNDYLSPIGVFDYLQDQGTGGNTTWTLARPDGHVLHFRNDGRLTSIVDRDDLQWTVTYIEASGGEPARLWKIADPLSREIVLDYTYYPDAGFSQHYLLTSVTVPGGLQAHFAYDDLDVRESLGPTTITDAEGDAYQFSYNTSGPCDTVSALTAPSGRRVNYGYQYEDGMRAWKLAYMEIDGQPSSHVDYYVTPSDGTDRWVDVCETKDGSDRVTRYIHTNDTSADTTYGTLSGIVKDPGTSPHLNLMRNWAFDSDFRLIRHRDGWQPETGGKAHRHFFYYGYNPPDLRAGLVTRYVDPQNSDGGETGEPSPTCPDWEFEYDNNGDGAQLGRLTKITHPQDPTNRYTRFTYVSNTSRLSSVIVRDQDPSGNPIDRTTSFTYWDASKWYLPKTVTDGRGNVTAAYYDTNGYLDYIDPPFGNNVQVTANSVGDITAVTDGNGNTTSFAYDGIHRLTSTTYPSVGAGQKTRTFDWIWNGLDQVTDENGRVTKFEYDAYTRRIWKVHEDYTGLNYVTTYGYDEVGNLKTVLNARGKTTTYFYDAGDRPYHADYPDSTHESLSYWDDGRVASHTDGRGRVTYYHYDADDRLTTVGSLKAVDYPNDTDVGIVRDADGLVTSHSDATGTTTIAYYPSMWVKYVQNGYGKKAEYEYNGVGGVSKLWADRTGNRYFTYTYNALNQISEVKDQDNNSLSSFTYDNGARLTRITRPGSYVQYNYNARNWLTAVQNRTTGGATLFDFSYYYQDGSLWDHAGNPLKRVDLVDATTYTTTYRYDNIYRMLSESRTPGNYSLVYTYDQVGNRLTRVKDGTTVTYTYDNNDKLTSASGGGQSATITYDNNGNMASVSGTMFGAWTFTHNDANRPTSIVYPTGTDTFIYNGLGQRMRGSLNGSVRRYFYNGNRVLEETNDSNGTLARYTLANSGYFAPLLHFKRSDGSMRYPLYDGVGSARRLADGAGTATDAYSLDAFGRYMGGWANPTPNPYRFGGAWGYLTDTPGSGLLQLGARYYWPELGRFIQQDPAGKGINWYAYVGNNPLAGVDPTGLITLPWEKPENPLPTGLANASNFAAGVGDEVSLGGTRRVRAWMGADVPDVVDPCSPWYVGGQWTGLGLTVATGLAGGIEAAGVKGAGKEFSHWIPKRWGGPRSIWNGNFVPKEVHAVSDPFRYRFMPRAWKEANSLLNPVAQQWVRLPNVYKGIGAGVGYGWGSFEVDDY